MGRNYCLSEKGKKIKLENTIIHHYDFYDSTYKEKEEALWD